MDANLAGSIITALIPVLTPVAVALIKKGLGDRFTALLPVVCSVLGVVVDSLNYVATGHNVGPAMALALGAAGVGVREAIDQLKKAA
jgi:hypothetical protein